MTTIPSVTIYNVPTRRIHSKVETYKSLFGTLLHTHIVKVQGSFIDEQGNNCFLEHRLCTVDMAKSKRLWLCVHIDEGWVMLRAERNIIDCVQIGVFQ